MGSSERLKELIRISDNLRAAWKEQGVYDLEMKICAIRSEIEDKIMRKEVDWNFLCDAYKQFIEDYNKLKGE